MIQASASRHHHGDSDGWNTGNIASVNRYQKGCAINLDELYKMKRWMSISNFDVSNQNCYKLTETPILL